MGCGRRCGRRGGRRSGKQALLKHQLRVAYTGPVDEPSVGGVHVARGCYHLRPVVNEVKEVCYVDLDLEDNKVKI